MDVSLGVQAAVRPPDRVKFPRHRGVLNIV